MSLGLLNQYDIIIFDCDGVLLDTNFLKCQAFGQAVEEYPKKIVDDFVEHCKRTFGVSRYIKFKEFFIDFAKEPFQEDKYNEMLKKYATNCSNIYQNAKITPGCINLLEELSSLNKKLYVASGSDEKELIDNFKNRELDKYFSKIYGSPRAKTECAAEIMRDNLNKKIVFIGDAISDMMTSKELGIDFIYASKFTVQSREQDEKCRIGSKLVVSTLIDLVF
jgi:HAD superfamily hydrolase (TIGR01549 family)